MIHVGRRLLTCAFLVSLVAASASSALADYVEVRRDANIKVAPERKAKTIRKAVPPELIALPDLPDEQIQQDGYYRVRIAEGEGWIYRTFVRRHAGPIPGTAEGADADLTGDLEVHVIDVGQADAILIRCPHGTHEMLIDAGDTRYPGSAKAFKAYLQREQPADNPIEVVVATHPHADHIGSMAWVLTTYGVDLYVDSGLPANTATYRRVDAALLGGDARHWPANDELLPEIDFCPSSRVNSRILRPAMMGSAAGVKAMEDDPNDASVVVRVDYGESSFLFTGDAEHVEEKWLVDDPQTRALLDCDFLKAGHHGSDTSSGADFLAAVTPEVVAISCGLPGVSTNAKYRHPRLESVERLLTYARPRSGAPTTVAAFPNLGDESVATPVDRDLYVTAVDGDLVFKTDGNSIQFVEP